MLPKWNEAELGQIYKQCHWIHNFWTYLSKVEVQNFDEIFREADQDSIHAPIGGEVSRDNSPHWTRRKNGFPWNPAFLKQTVN